MSAALGNWKSDKDPGYLTVFHTLRTFYVQLNRTWLTYNSVIVLLVFLFLNHYHPKSTFSKANV